MPPVHNNIVNINVFTSSPVFGPFLQSPASPFNHINHTTQVYLSSRFEEHLNNNETLNLGNLLCLIR